jgi:uncharacterized protein (UPF0332 family)
VKEINSLIERAKRYLKSAEILLEEGDYESSVSRTYYAMFYSAQAMLLTKNLSFSSHKGVISAFGEQFVKTPDKLEEDVEFLFEKIEDIHPNPSPYLEVKDDVLEKIDRPMN